MFKLMLFLEQVDHLINKQNFTLCLKFFSFVILATYIFLNCYTPLSTSKWNALYEHVLFLKDVLKLHRSAFWSSLINSVCQINNILKGLSGRQYAQGKYCKSGII